MPITIFLTACIAVVAACASTSPPSEAPRTATRQPSTGPVATGALPDPNAWIEPAAYTFTLTSACGERALIGSFRVKVEDHRTVAFSRVDAAGSRFQGGPGSIPTLGAILEEATDAKARNASRVDVTSDLFDGHPVDVAIDRVANGIDDESCYRISDYVVTADAAPST